MLSSPAARDSKHERFGRERQPSGCEGRHDLICARVKLEIDGATRNRWRYERAVLSEPAFWNPSGPRQRAAKRGEHHPVGWP
jgi:hypothetical protein